MSLRWFGIKFPHYCAVCGSTVQWWCITAVIWNIKFPIHSAVWCRPAVIWISGLHILLRCRHKLLIAGWCVSLRLRSRDPIPYCGVSNAVGEWWVNHWWLMRQWTRVISTGLLPAIGLEYQVPHPLCIVSSSTVDDGIHLVIWNIKFPSLLLRGLCLALLYCVVAYQAEKVISGISISSPSTQQCLRLLWWFGISKFHPSNSVSKLYCTMIPHLALFLSSIASRSGGVMSHRGDFLEYQVPSLCGVSRLTMWMMFHRTVICGISSSPSTVQCVCV
jgi:hypothetical protein